MRHYQSRKSCDVIDARSEIEFGAFRRLAPDSPKPTEGPAICQKKARDAVNIESR